MFNNKFGIHINDNMNCFIDVISKDEIPFTLSIKTPRKILSGNIIRY